MKIMKREIMGNNGNRLAQIFVRTWNRLRSISQELLRIETKKTYLKAAQTVRLTVLGIFSLWILCTVAMTAVVMFHVSVFLSFPDAKRLWAALLLTAADLIALRVLAYRFFSEKKWMEYSRYYRWLYCGPEKDEPPPQ